MPIFSYDIAVLGTPQCPPLYFVESPDCFSWVSRFSFISCLGPGTLVVGIKRWKKWAWKWPEQESRQGKGWWSLETCCQSALQQLNCHWNVNISSSHHTCFFAWMHLNINMERRICCDMQREHIWILFAQKKKRAERSTLFQSPTGVTLALVKRNKDVSEENASWQCDWWRTAECRSSRRFLNFMAHWQEIEQQSEE